MGLLGQLQNLFGALRSPQQSATPAPVRGNPTSQQGTPAEAPTDMSQQVQATSAGNRAVAQNTSENGGGNGGGGGGTGGSGGASGLSPIQLAFSLKYYKQEELKTRVFEYSLQQAREYEVAPQGLFTTIIQGYDLDDLIKEIDLDDDFFDRIISTVSVVGDFESAGISAVTVNLEYPATRKPNEAPQHVDGFVFRPGEMDPQTFTTWLNDKGDREYRYKMQIDFTNTTPWHNKDYQIVTEWVTTNDRQLTLNPLDAISFMEIPVTLGDFDSNSVSQAQVEVVYEYDNDTTVRKTFLTRPGDETQSLKMQTDASDSNKYKYNVLYFLPDNRRYATEWEETDDLALIVNEPYKGMFNVRMVPNLDAHDLLEAIINLTYVENGFSKTIEVLFTPEELRSRRISFPILTDVQGSYVYEGTIVKSTGEVVDIPPQVSDSRVIVISEGEGVTQRINVKLANPHLSSMGLMGVHVSIESSEGERPDRDSVWFSDSQTGDQAISLVHVQNGHAPKYKYTVTGYTFSGDRVEGVTEEGSDQTLVVKAAVPIDQLIETSDQQRKRVIHIIIN